MNYLKLSFKEKKRQKTIKFLKYRCRKYAPSINPDGFIEKRKFQGRNLGKWRSKKR